MFKTSGMIFSLAILLQGCSGISSNPNKPADVTSTPSGATVYANNLELGKTPLRHNLYDAFPAGWEAMIYQAQGVLMVKMDGCEDFTLQVTDYILSKPIHAELKCNVVSKPEKLTATTTPLSGAEKRLEEVDALYKKGVITEEEYKKTRERILNEL